MRNVSGENYVLPADEIVENAGYILKSGTIAAHGGYITKGDNNAASDQGSLSFAGVGTIEPVAEEWVVGKALFTVPYIGLLPLHIGEVIIAVIILMGLYEIYLRRKEAAAAAAKPQKKGKKQR
jgi:signal peptidase